MVSSNVRKKMSDIGWKKWLIAGWAVLECLLFSGLLFGWGSLNFVLKQEGIYADLCESTNGNVEITNETGLENINKSTPTHLEDGNQHNEPCIPQDDKMALCFTIASSMLGIWCVLIGILNYKLGSRVTRLISFLLFESGAIMMAMLSKEQPWWIFPGFGLMCMGGMPIMTTNLQVANLFAVGGSSVVCLLNGMFDSSSVVMLLLKILHERGFARRNFFFVIAAAHCIVLVSTVFFLPKTFIEKSTDTPDEKVEKTTLDETVGKNTSLKGPRLKDCLLHKTFLTNMFWMSALNLRFTCFTGTINQYLTRVLRDEGQVSYFTDVCYYTMLGGIVGSFVTGALYDWRTKKCKDGESTLYRDVMPSVLPLSVTSLVAVSLSILVLIPEIYLLYSIFIVMTIYRSFMFSSTATIIRNAFPSQYLVFLYGTMHFVSSLFSLLQYPIYTWGTSYNGAYVHADIFLLCLTFVTLAHPLYWWITCNNEEKHLKNKNLS